VSDRQDGDFHPFHNADGSLDSRQQRLIGRRFWMVNQVHGTAVLDTEAANRWPVLGRADVIVSNHRSPKPVGVWAADCAPIALFGAAGTVVGVHAGWRGLASGVVDVAADVLLHRGESVAAVVVGPMIHPDCYAFGLKQLTAVAHGVGAEADAITAITADGGAALDVPAAVTAALRRRDLAPDVLGDCTGCNPRWFSHRVRSDTERHALVAWIEPARATVRT
jgi:copper oxidase (laccase) domain-containing protein